MVNNKEVYIVLGDGEGLGDRLASRGYRVLQELAGGSLVLIVGPRDSEDDLRSLPTVNDAVANQTFEVGNLTQQTKGSVSDTTSLSEQQWDKELTNTFAAHDIATGDGTTLAVIDTGVSPSHPDLESRVDLEQGRLFRNGQIHAGQILIRPHEDGEFGRDTVELPVGADIDGHGTHVAGIAAANGTDSGIIGTAPATTIVPLRTMFYRQISDHSSVKQITVADTLHALDYAVEIGADVVNISLGAGPLSASVTRQRLFSAFRRVIQHAVKQGTVVVVAGGDQGADFHQDPPYELPSANRGVISVAATGPNDKRRHDSNYGDNVIDVAAPGGGYDTQEKTWNADISEWGILSSLPKYIGGEQYGYNAGTSMAAPQVTGLACLIREIAPGLHPRRVKQAIEKGAVELSGENTAGLGAGRIDAIRSIERVSSPQ